MKPYLEKSKDTKEEFFDGGGTIYNLGERGWIEYEIIGSLFWIRTMFWDTKDMKETHEVWNNIKDFAKRHKCIKIQFTTKRDGKLWERRFKDMKTIQWKIEADLNE